MEQCLFCRIIKGEIPAIKIYEDEFAFAFNDINPQAPRHILVIPREHFAHIHEIPQEKREILAGLFNAVGNIVGQEGMIKEGYRLVVNSGENSGQAVFHIHVHILFGRKMKWPPG
jgi:histidine triad (HIT) family protein